jgi:AmmeMemoRadiSam system protein A
VPLWHLVDKGWDGPTVVLGLNHPGEGGLIELGQSIQEAAARLGRRIAVVASGDMSHRLKPHAPAGYDPRAIDFDLSFIDTVRRGAYRGVLELDPELQELAAEDVVDSTVIAMSSIDWNTLGHEVLSYEGPFGVGYGVAVLFNSQARTREKVCRSSSGIDDGKVLPAVARDSLMAALGGGADRIPSFEGDYLGQRHGVFVTIRTRNGDLRGCVGTIHARYPNIVEETWQLARDAGFRDHRFSPVEAAEIPDLVFEVSVMGALEPVSSPDDLDPQRWGVVVSTADGRRGTLLPGIPEIETAAEQIELARRKACIHACESVRLERFATQKFVGEQIEKPED